MLHTSAQIWLGCFDQRMNGGHPWVRIGPGRQTARPLFHYRISFLGLVFASHRFSRLDQSHQLFRGKLTATVSPFEQTFGEIAFGGVQF